MNYERIEAWIAQTNQPHNRPAAIMLGGKLDSADIMNDSSPPPSDVHIVNDIDKTPKPRSKRRKLGALETLSHRPQLNTEGTPSLNGTNSITTSTRSTHTGTTGAGRSRGSRSPVKGVSDLRFGEKPVNLSELDSFDKLPSDVAALFGHVRMVCGHGQNIVPISVKDDFLSALTPIDMGFSDASFYDAQQWATEQRLQAWDAARELEIFTEVVANTKECKRENLSEPAWNARVHEPLLNFVFKCFAGHVRHYDVTRAAIDKPYITSLEAGVDMQSKMVDFCIALAGDGIMRTARRRNDVNKSTSINHTSYEPVRDRPIAVNIETKTPASSSKEAEAQLSVWTLGHLKRLRSLACTSNSTLVIDVTIPVIYVCGGDWKLYFVRDRVDGIDLIEACSIGDTRTLVGCYKVATFLRYLGVWMKTVYQDWLLENALVVQHTSVVENTVDAEKTDDRGNTVADM
ncbi:hypothetical protein QQZ08_003714 [Neonectria magnoliae]|uniref:PD-(D/E)XK nuclease-like domain-containing protein n=1 Tax=Neonectria magnoliae TaxID=2732573 RepID=A0ABR1I7W9_9HYPO